MDPDRIAAIYEELQRMVVPVDPTVERGPQYLLEQLQTCRRYQDRILQLSAEVSAETARAKKGLRAAKAALELVRRSKMTEGSTEQAVRELQDRMDDLQGLERVLGVARTNMRTTDSDIRLAAALVALQLRLGQVLPGPMPATPGLDRDVCPSFREEARESPQSAVVEAGDEDIAQFLSGEGGQIDGPLR